MESESRQMPGRGGGRDHPPNLLHPQALMCGRRRWLVNCAAQGTPSPLRRSSPSADIALTAPECWAEGEEGKESEAKAELAEGNHLRTVRPAAFPSYLCSRHVGRIHDPGLA